ncbi:MAG: bifunctional acetate--CoA ligase family protein/GNAT family N-acetyltransferase [Gammaproteobacteria bacterium]|nr:bifunctional acetate--CoA ligase family protein/GNAT family N-acetyltransferase [Gammaproteobacteria bacterium]
MARIFEPGSVAVIGASERPGSLGRVVFRNLVDAGFPGPLYPVNPKHDSIGGRRCFARIGDVGAPVDLAVIVSPARTVPGVIAECGAAGVGAAVILSGGFREAGDEGRALEDEVVAAAARHGIRFLGPNCLGVLRPAARLNASFSHAMAEPGRIALVSQSGAVCTALLDWAAARDIGFSNVVSTGIGADVDFGEILDYLLLDTATKAIMLYIEGVHDARRFMSALRAASRAKPIVVMKVGRHALGERAAISHTGALVGADEVFDAALDRAGVVRVTEYADFFAVAETLHVGTAGRGPRLAIVTNGGGPAVMAADAVADKGLELAELTDASARALDAVLPAASSRANPVDVLGDADAERYTAALRVCLADPDVDAVLAILIPTALTKPLDVAQGVIEAARQADKPLLTCWMGDAAMRPSWASFREHRVPVFRSPEDAVEAFAAVAAHYRNRQLLLQAPDPLRRRAPPDTEAARRIVEAAIVDGRRVLDPLESQAVLAAFHIPVLGSVAARSADEAVEHARGIGYPLAMKLLSPDVTHKTDVGGVRLDVAGDDAVARAFGEIVGAARAARPDARIGGVLLEPMRRSSNARELMLGIVADPVFGPVLSVGLGGTMVEIVGDKAVELPPLNHYLTERMIDRTRAAKYLKTFRGKPEADRGAVVDAVLRLSEIACELPWVEELDINPLLVDESGATAIDARVVLRPAPRSALPYSHMAIHPYPSHLAWSYVLRDGVTMRMRPIRPEDALLEKRFVEQLSERSRYLRFMYSLRELTPEMLSRFTQIDYDREMALIAIVETEQGDEQVGVARYVANADPRSCEFAVVVADRWQGHGIATRLLRNLIDVARERRFERMDGIVLRENVNMLALARELGFRERAVADDPKLVQIVLELA